MVSALQYLLNHFQTRVPFLQLFLSCHLSWFAPSLEASLNVMRILQDEVCVEVTVVSLKCKRQILLHENWELKASELKVCSQRWLMFTTWTFQRLPKCHSICSIGLRLNLCSSLTSCTKWWRCHFALKLQWKQQRNIIETESKVKELGPFKISYAGEKVNLLLLTSNRNTWLTWVNLQWSQ